MNELQQKFFDNFGEQAELLNKAYEYAARMHSGQKRESGEPYIVHPEKVAEVLLELGLDYATIAAALLHDCIEDTAATESELRELFGDKITELVLGVTKLDKITFKSKAEEQAENFRKMFLAMAQDFRVILVKLADRLHNMRTINVLSRERQTAMAKETMEIYAPLAARLGLSYFKCELEDLCMKVLHPEDYDKLVCEVSLKRAERTEFVEKICNELAELLKAHKIKGEINGRPKHFYSIYKKMKRDNKPFDQIYDLTAVRVIVDSTLDCYEVLGMIHAKWKPIPGRFKDYIAVPKANNYQSIHTTVITSYGMPFEIQIRTYEMHKIAEYGIAAHWKYKENRAESNDLDEKLKWLRGVMDVQSDAVTSEDFFESIKLDLYSEQVFIFTPKGDVMVLPKGSTPVDFAYAVHSGVGNKCVGAKINGKIVPLKTELQTGDYVEIVTSGNAKGPSRDWLGFVKSAQAKTKIRAFFKKELKEENIKKGKDMLEIEAKNRGYAIGELLVAKWLDVVMQRYSITSLDDLYASVGYGGLTVNQVLLRLIDFYKKEVEITPKIKKDSPSAKKRDGQGVVVGGHSDLLVRLARCCSPVPGDDIVGFISRGRGVAVHRRNCPNLKNVDDFCLIEAHWENTAAAAFIVPLQIHAINSNGLVARVTQLLAEMKVVINSLNARIDRNKKAVIDVSVRVSRVEDIDALIKKIHTISDVEDVFRSTGA